VPDGPNPVPSDDRTGLGRPVVQSEPLFAVEASRRAPLDPPAWSKSTPGDWRSELSDSLVLIRKGLADRVRVASIMPFRSPVVVHDSERTDLAAVLHRSLGLRSVLLLSKG
jgi:hypothetical protein